MKALAQLVMSREEWLIQRVLAYAKEHGFTEYTSTLAEAWRISISGLSEALATALDAYDAPPELSPKEDYTEDPIASFGVLEAKRHRARGITLGMFLGLMKYYRQSYVDLVLEAGYSPEDTEHRRLFVERFFDRVELGFCVEWARLGESARTEELEAGNREITNEKNKYVTIFESLHDPVVLLDEQNRIDNLNHAAATLFEGLNVPGSAYYHRENGKHELPWLSKELADMASSGESELPVEKRIQTRKGLRSFQIKLQRMLDVSGKFMGTVVVFNDVTGRQAAEHALYESRERLNLALRSSGVGTWSWDIPGHKLIWDDYIHPLFGLEPGAFGGTYEAFLSMLHARDRQRVAAEIKQATEQDAPYDTEYQVVWPDGSLHELGSRGKVYRDEEGKPVRMTGVCWDMTAHKRAEEALARERNLLRTLVDNLPDYIFAKDAESRFILNNTAHLRLLRADTQDDVAGKTDYDIFPRQLAAQYFNDEQAIVQSGESLVNREESVVTEQGEKHWLLTTKVPLKDAQGDIAGIVGMSRNITERKQMAEALKRHAVLLEQANRDLAARNKELDEFTYIASHDLQEPLRKLTAFSDMLLEDMQKNDESEVRQDLKVITSAAERMQRLVRDLLALSRSGRRSMNVEDVPLDECVDSALDALEIRVAETGAEIARGALPVVRGDKGLLVQLYQNLIGNALKFHGEAAPRIELRAEKVKDHWELAVQDNGIGLKPEYAEQIFSPFRRLHHRNEYEGTGIGLAICRKIVERHAGTIWVKSELDKGACFKFTLGEHDRKGEE